MSSSEDDPPLTDATNSDVGESTDDGALRAALGMETRPPPVSLTAGQVIDDAYRIERKLGAGGMGVVYLARDLRLHRDVAIKLHTAITGEAGGERLTREATAMAQLAHPNVATVHEVGTWAGHPFVAMEYVAGGTARDWLAAQPRTPREILAVFLAAGRGLAAAHVVGLVHRDFKPDNVLVGDDGRVRVADFGLARGFDHEQAPGVPDDLPLDDLTATGSVVGTPAYMAPEQRGAGKVGPAADQFAFAVALWEALARERPYPGATNAQLAASIAGGKLRPPPPPRQMPTHVARALTRALAADPAARYPSMDALITELARDPAARRRRIAAAAGVLALVAALAVAVVVARRRGAGTSPCQSGHDAEQVWNDERRAATRDAFATVGTSWATIAGERAVTELDRRATGWTQASMAACRAARVTRTWTDELFARARRCLDRRLGELGATAAVLATADVAVAEHAGQLVDRLPDAAACADPALLDLAAPPPADPELAAAVAAAEQDLERALVEARAGRYDASLALVDPLIERAAALGHAPLIAEVAQMRARLAVYRGEDDALARLEEAFYLARQSGQPIVAVDIAIDLANRSADVGDREAGERWYRMADADVVGLRLGPDYAGRTAISHAIILDNADRGEEARAEAERGLAIRRALHPGDDTHDDILEAMETLAVIDEGLGRYADSVRLGRDALAAHERRDGRDHPSLIYLLTNLGLAMSSAGEHEAAIEHQQRALALSRANLPPTSIHIAYALLNLGVALIEAQRPDEAIAPLRESAAIIVAASGVDSEDNALVEGQLGLALMRTGAYAEATATLTSALGHARVVADGADTFDIARILQNLGAAANDSGHPADAIPRYREALAMFERLQGNTASVQTDLATALLEVHQPREALTAAEAALASFAGSGVDGDTIARVELLIARSAWATGDHARARASAASGAEHVDSDAVMREALARWLAEHPSN